MIKEVIICGVIGMILQMLMKARSIQEKAKLSNVQFKFWSYFTEDWLSHMISAFAVALYVYLAKARLKSVPDNLYEVVLGFSATVGYTGADLVSRFFSFTNKRINSAIDFKTTQADTASGTLQTPTPATKP